MIDQPNPISLIEKLISEAEDIETLSKVGASRNDPRSAKCNHRFFKGLPIVDKSEMSSTYNIKEHVYPPRILVSINVECSKDVAKTVRAKFEKHGTVHSIQPNASGLTVTVISAYGLQELDKRLTLIGDLTEESGGQLTISEPSITKCMSKKEKEDIAEFINTTEHNFKIVASSKKGKWKTESYAQASKAA